VVQNRLYADTGYDREIRAYCKKQRILYQSFWTLTANPRVLAHATIAALAKKYRRTPAQIFFRYLTQSGVVPLNDTEPLSGRASPLMIDSGHPAVANTLYNETL
jgi:diketogulonate reductase-like aldo/keto reductase